MQEINFKRNVLGLLSTQGLLLMVNFISSVLLARWLGPQAKGEFSIATGVYMIAVQIGILGLHSAHTYFISKDYKKLSFSIGNSLLISLSVGFVATIFISSMTLIKPSMLRLNLSLVLLVCFMIPIQLFWTFQSQNLLALNELRVKNISDLLNAILLIIVAACFYWTVRLTVAKLLLITLAIAASILLYSYRYLCKKYKCKPKISIKFFKESLKYGLKAHIACLLAYLLLRIDVFMINAYLGNTEVGIYSLAVNLADILSLISVSVGMLLFPVASAYTDDKKRYFFTKKVLKSVMLMLLPIAIFLFLTVQFWLPILYGKSYCGAIVAFRILLPGVVFWGLEGIIANFFASIQKFKTPIIAMAIALLLNIFLNSILLQKHGINGAAISSTISYGIAFIIMYINFYRHKKEGS